jgi:diguanylate cyclase (GGDEF)-like protein
MTGAEIVLVANIAVAAMFTGSYLTIALTNWSQRGALWFAVTGFIGMLSPISYFAVSFTTTPMLLEWSGYASFLAATLGMSASFRHFHGKRPQWRVIAAIFIGGLLTRGWIWEWTRDSLAYGFAYQLPLILAALLATHTMFRVDGRTALHVALTVMFGAIAVNLAIKPFLAAAFGSGGTLSGYSSTTYALMSQSSTGILLLGVGMALLLIVAQRAIAGSQFASENDPLSGVANRRGFDRQAQELLAQVTPGAQPLSVAVFDLDHFKQINDSYGHQTGDAVIAAFGALLRNTAPSAAILGRMGGEEFAMLVPRSNGADTWIFAETIRLETLRDTRETIGATVSGGVAECRLGETLAEMMRRADQALYQAKSEGRNRVCMHGDVAPAAEDEAVSNVVPLRGRVSA